MQLIERNLRLVVSVARQYTGRGLPVEDLVQEGNLALMRVVDSFPVGFRGKFSTYAVICLKRAMQRAIIDKGHLIRLPYHAYRAAMAQYLASEDDAMPVTVSLETMIEGNHGALVPLADFVADGRAPLEETVCRNDDVRWVRSALAGLSDADWSILDRYWWQEQSYADIAGEMGVWFEAARQRERSARRRLRELLDGCMV